MFLTRFPTKLVQENGWHAFGRLFITRLWQTVFAKITHYLLTSSAPLRWLEIVSWRARPGPLIARARASTPGSRRGKFSDLVPLKILQNFYFDPKYLWKLTVKICKIWQSRKERTEISVLIERNKSVRSKQIERENRIIWNFSKLFLQNFLKIGSLVGFNVQNNFSKFGVTIFSWRLLGLTRLSPKYYFYSSIIILCISLFTFFVYIKIYYFSCLFSFFKYLFIHSFIVLI